jgi:hypothetical protein
MVVDSILAADLFLIDKSSRFKFSLTKKAFAFTKESVVTKQKQFYPGIV